MKITPQFGTILFLVIIILGASLEVYSGLMSAGDLFVGLATLFLAFATIQLVWNEIDASRKERTRERLKERLEGLYSPLMGLGDIFEIPENHFALHPTSVGSTMTSIRNVYSYLASNALKIQLDLYYKHFYFPRHMPDSDTLKALRVVFTEDFEEITKEYRQLTISETEEKRRANILKAKKEMKNPR